MTDLLIHLKFIYDIETPVSYRLPFTEKCFQNSSFVFFDGTRVSHLTVLVQHHRSEVSSVVTN